MAEYLIQDTTMTAMANQMRRISGTSDSLTGAEIAEIFSRTQGTLKTDGEHLVEALNYDGTVIKSGTYDTGEIFAMPKDANGNDLLEFDTWVATSPVTNNYCVVDNIPIQAGAIMKPVDDCLIIGIETVEENTEVEFYLGSFPDNIIDWGDGTIESIDLTRNPYHTFSTIGSYVIKISNPNYEKAILSSLCKELCKSLIKYVYIPSWIQVSCIELFTGFINLQYVTFASGISYHSIDDNYRMFGNSSIECVVLPNGFPMPKYIFGNYSSYNGIKSEGMGVKKVILPHGITEIPEGCFDNNENIKHLIIPSSVTSIGKRSFSFTALETLVITSNITSIGDYAFYNNNGYKSVESLIILSDTVPQINNTTFMEYYGSDKIMTVGAVYVLDNLVDSYKADENWSAYSDASTKIKPLSEYTGQL